MKEYTLILLSCQLHLENETINQIKQLCQEELDWSLFKETAMHHRVDTFIYYTFSQHKLIEYLDPEVLKAFKLNYLSNSFRNNLILNNVEHLLSLIDNQSKVVLLKGVDFLNNLYPNISIRQMTDIDMLVEKEKGIDIWNDLIEKGLFFPPRKNSNYKDYMFKHHHFPVLYKNDIAVEIHWSLFFLDTEEIILKEAWQATKKNPKKDNSFYFTTEFNIVYQALHFFMHLNENGNLRLNSLCDINELVNQSEIDWAKVEAICKRCKISNEIYKVFTLVKNAFNTNIPKNLLLSSISYNPTWIFHYKAKEEEDLSKLSYFTKVRRIKSIKGKFLYTWSLVFPNKDWVILYFGKSNNVFHAYLNYWKKGL